MARTYFQLTFSGFPSVEYFNLAVVISLLKKNFQIKYHILSIICKSQLNDVPYALKWISKHVSVKFSQNKTWSHCHRNPETCRSAFLSIYLNMSSRSLLLRISIPIKGCQSILLYFYKVNFNGFYMTFKS